MPIILTLVGILLLLVVPLSYVIRQMSKPPKNAPEQFLKQGAHPQDRKVVVCLGASMVHGRVGVNFVDLLSRRLPESESKLVFVNAGVNGDTSYHARRRLDSVIACNPDYVIILVGTNDVICTLNPDSWRMYKGEKRLPVQPTVELYRDNL
jgi:lysophospholipase L1-like esterase